MIGISIITCSINPELCNKMLESIKTTIGIDYETIIFDNREKKMSICQVYNSCAKKAKYSYLCFIHEDVVMTTLNWGLNMLDFAEKTTNCGVIGFAGGRVVHKNFTGWSCGLNGRYRFYDPSFKKKAYSIEDLCLYYYNPDNEEYSKVTTVDGAFLFVSREVWKKNQFDEQNIKDFHVYDADFSFSVAQEHQNYVCLNVDIFHFSGGCHDKNYFNNIIYFQNKWKKQLPYYFDGSTYKFKDELKKASYLFVQSIRNGFTIKQSIKNIIKINNVFFFFLFCIYILYYMVNKRITGRE